MKSMKQDNNMSYSNECAILASFESVGLIKTLYLYNTHERVI